MFDFIKPKTTRTALLIRNVTTEECPWLKEDLNLGTILFEYRGYTFNCLTSRGVAVTLEPDSFPFTEVPADSVLWSQ